MIEVTNACTTVLTKARNSLIFGSIDKLEKRTIKMLMVDILSNGLHEKVIAGF